MRPPPQYSLRLGSLCVLLWGERAPPCLVATLLFFSLTPFPLFRSKRIFSAPSSGTLDPVLFFAKLNFDHLPPARVLYYGPPLFSAPSPCTPPLISLRPFPRRPQKAAFWLMLTLPPFLLSLFSSSLFFFLFPVSIFSFCTFVKNAPPPENGRRSLFFFFRRARVPQSSRK